MERILEETNDKIKKMKADEFYWGDRSEIIFGDRPFRRSERSVQNPPCHNALKTWYSCRQILCNSSNSYLSPAQKSKIMNWQCHDMEADSGSYRYGRNRLQRSLWEAGWPSSNRRRSFAVYLSIVAHLARPCAIMQEFVSLFHDSTNICLREQIPLC